MKKLISIFLSLLMLASSMGLAVNTHYCGGEAMSSQLTLGQVHTNCGMENMGKSCTNKDITSLSQSNSCCQDEYISLDTDDATDHKVVVEQVNPEFVLALTFSFLGIDPFFQDTNNLTYRDYSPPLYQQDRQVLFQSFLI